MVIALIKEGKTPPDKRVPLTPDQCVEVMKLYPDVEIIVQRSSIRAIKDEEYQSRGIRLVDNPEEANILLGVKEVPKEELIPGKTYLFFSHTYKMQPYNKELLKAILEKKISLVDYELMTKPNGVRLIGFGRYAGIVGAYNGFRGWGMKSGDYTLKPAHLCVDRKEVELEMEKVVLPADFRLVVTGKGRVGNGAREIISLLNIKEVSPREFLNEEFSEPVFTHLIAEDYNKHKEGKPFEKSHFYANPQEYESAFLPFAKRANMYIACHYWDAGAPFIFTREDARSPDFNIKLVADVSCDIDGPVACTLRPSTIADPFYGYDPLTESETAFEAENAIGVMAVDNLPCELPKDASADFGNELVKNILPNLLGNDALGIIERARETTLEGELTPDFKYLEPWVNS